MTLDKINTLNIVLASNSPRRKALLENAGIRFRTVTGNNVDETVPKHISHKEAAEYLSVKKNKAYRRLFDKNTVLITADTTVLLAGTILDKPKDDTEAEDMLNLISGNTHEVRTGVCISGFGQKYHFTERSVVEFAHLDISDIQYYIRHYKPFDKAGAYGIQEWIGHIGIKKIEGSFDNIVGLPVFRVYQSLKDFAEMKHN